MRRSLLLSLALLACGVMSYASYAADEKPGDESAKKDEGEKKTLKDELQEIQKAHQEFSQELQKKFTEAEEAEAKEKIRDEFFTGGPFIAQAIELAKKEPKSDVALQALQFAIQVGRLSPQKGQAVELLLEHHGDSPFITQLIQALGQAGGPDDVKLLDMIAEKSDSKEHKGLIAYTKAEAYYNQADEAADDEKKDLLAKAEAAFEEVTDEYEGVVAGRQNLAEAAGNFLFELRNLQVGMKVPDVTMENLKGEKESLSDYKGKVVVIDVWATWCPPCRDMIPHERKMVEKLKDKPFALISVSGDQEKKTLEEFLEKEKMPWNHWWDDRKGEGIVSKWNIRYFPTIYIVDAKGVIRHKGLRGEAMEEAVVELLKEAEGEE